MTKFNEKFNLLRPDLQKSLSASHIDPDTLSAFQRILLTTDGMVTEMLEAYLQEHMIVSKLAQSESRVPRRIRELQLDEGSTVMHRRILLQGQDSQANHLYAESSIAVDRLIDPIRAGLMHSRKPIGLLILENRLETFREILVCETEAAGDLAIHFGIAEDAALLSRTYLVFARSVPIMLITEKFPQSSFADRL